MIYLYIIYFFLISGRDIHPLYAGSKGANERLRRLTITARHLVRECLIDVDRAQR